MCRSFVQDHWHGKKLLVGLRELLLCQDSMNTTRYDRAVLKARVYSRDERQYRAGPAAVITSSRDDPESSTIWPFVEGAAWSPETYNTERILCQLETNHGAMIGWVPATAQVNGRVYVFKGAARPFLLHGPPEGPFILLGDCWFPGFPPDEAAKYCEQDELEWVTLQESAVVPATYG